MVRQGVIALPPIPTRIRSRNGINDVRNIKQCNYNPWRDRRPILTHWIDARAIALTSIPMKGRIILLICQTVEG